MSAKSSSVFQEMLRLLVHVADKLAGRLLRADVLSLLGRALFFRFLVDRAIVTLSDLPRLCPSASTFEDCFINAANSARTSDWLDRTFNGNFLPLTGNGGTEFFTYVQDLFPAAFKHLSAIVQRWEPAGDAYQSKMEWATFDFAHVPVGLPSQVYEAFCWKVGTQDGRSSSKRSLPRREYPCRNLSRRGIRRTGERTGMLPGGCACGAGVFLGACLSAAVLQERWKAPGLTRH